MFVMLKLVLSDGSSVFVLPESVFVFGLKNRNETKPAGVTARSCKRPQAALSARSLHEARLSVMMSITRIALQPSN